MILSAVLQEMLKDPRAEACGVATDGSVQTGVYSIGGLCFESGPISLVSFLKRAVHASYFPDKMTASDITLPLQTLCGAPKILFKGM